jgi:hypothetical protein
LRAATSSDPGGANDLAGWALDTADVEGEMRAERSGKRRTYSLRYEGRDAAGNTAECTATVLVPKSRGGDG